MSDGEEKKATLPAWQQTGQQKDAASSSTGADDIRSTSTTTHHVDERTTNPSEADAATAVAPTASPNTTEDAENEQRRQLRSFLEEDTVRDQPVDKKRAFLQSKGMPAKLIEDELLSAEMKPFKESDFKAFQQDTASQTQTQSESMPSAETISPLNPPPIITYPEFLANAHRPMPLITPGRILTTTYIASAAAALLYGASTLLVRPMMAVLTEARHDFATHSNSKIQELNTRLEKAVSQVPGVKSGSEYSDSDLDSLASDPTELFHRDVGTQTDASVQSSKPAVQVAFVNNDSAAAQANKLNNLEKQLDTLLKGMDTQGEAIREREESASKLRHYLDSLAYSGAGVWNHHGVGYGWEPTSQQYQTTHERKTDPIEDLKREIRGVKGVLLSAKRFPAAAQNSQAGRYKSPAPVPA